MEIPFQVDKFHFNNHLGEDYIGDRFSGFSLDDQSKVLCILFNEEHLTEDQIEELQRVTLILAQQQHDSVLQPLAWGKHDGRHYAVFRISAGHWPVMRTSSRCHRPSC